MDVLRTLGCQPQRRERWFGAILIGLLALAWPLASWHELTTLHEVCSEHGEILDVHVAAEEEHDGPRATPDDGKDHDVCPFAPLAQPATSGGSEPVLVLLSLRVVSVAEPADAPRAPRLPRYFLAPKQSPPVGRAS